MNENDKVGFPARRAPPRKRNIGTEKPAVDPETRDRIRELNAGDAALYEAAWASRSRQTIPPG